MASATFAAPTLAPPPPAPAASVFLPKEHGSWSLALEPVALGLLVAPTSAGAALGLAALAGFFLRRPLRALLTDRNRHHGSARTALLVLAGCAAAALALTVAEAGLPALWPLLLAAPPGLVFLWFDCRNESRSALAEIAGGAAFGLLPAALATVAGWSPAAALALSALMLARTLPTILTVRTCLRRRKGEPTSPAWSVVSTVVALAALRALSAAGLLPAAAGWLGVLFVGRTLIVLSPLCATWPAKRLGMAEAVLGVTLLAVAALAYR